MNLTYFSNLPNPPDDPADDVGGMQINSASINSWVGIDHLGFGTNIGGYHNLLHLVDQKTSPDPSSPIGKFYNQTPNGQSDTILFYKSAGGVLTQLTGPDQTSTMFTGYTWINGGILLQWGFQNQVPSQPVTGSTSFRIPFPTRCLMVTATPYFGSLTNAPNHNATISIYSNNNPQPTQTDFSWAYYSTSSRYSGFYWIAIGF